MQRLPFTIGSPVLIVLLTILCCLAAFDLFHQYQMSNEAYWFYQYTEAVRATSEFWNYGFRLERLEEKNDLLVLKLNNFKKNLVEDSFSFRKAVTSHVALSQRVGDTLQNDTNLIQIRCGDNNGLLRLGASDFRADSRDACQLFSGTITTASGPETTFEKIYQGDGAFSLRSISSNLFLQVTPPPLDNIAAPWKVVAGSPAPGPAERFWASGEGYLYNALMGGYLQCSNEEMVKGYPGTYSTPNVFELNPVSRDVAHKYRQLVSLSDQIEQIQGAYMKESKRRIAKEKLSSAGSAQQRAGGGALAVTKICMGVPMTSVKTSMLEVADSPLWTNLFSSFMETVDWKSDRFVYAFYLGFDKADPIYDTGDAWHDMRQEFTKRATLFLKTQLLDDTSIEKILRERLSIKLFHYEHLEGAPSQVVSQVMLQAYGDGYDYFYQVNDDTQLNSLNWAEYLVEALVNSEPISNFGVTGPRDSNNEKIFTHSFTHRTHIEIFGHLFPPSFKNWWSDDWISTVYGGAYTFLLTKVQIRHNVEAQKTAGYTRYEVDMVMIFV
jgi:hypothetical protein